MCVLSLCAQFELRVHLEPASGLRAVSARLAADGDVDAKLRVECRAAASPPATSTRLVCHPVDYSTRTEQYTRRHAADYTTLHCTRDSPRSRVHQQSRHSFA